ncbi:hypothetical protein NDU88_002061 [Pleurodeles waltl]|uniref:Uncharacterized protein n=1 Tax=Pleurodeles waltl TaxID=8319 RepID=A0AAV7RCY2_PLEWA|nr:hypothetical protein NDU88_002061 [Pleurodeles waltl]
MKQRAPQKYHTSRPLDYSLEYTRMYLPAVTRFCKRHRELYGVEYSETPLNLAAPRSILPPEAPPEKDNEERRRAAAEIHLLGNVPEP